MRTLEQIKNEYAVSKGFENFHDIKKRFRNRDMTFFEFGKHLKNCDVLIQEECLKRASENVTTVHHKECKTEDVSKAIHYTKNSITNENNIIK